MPLLPPFPSLAAAAASRRMVLIGSGLLQAALEARSAPALVVVCGREVIANSASCRSLLEGVSVSTELPHDLKAFANVVCNSEAQATELSIGRKKIQMSGAPYTDAETGKTFAIISLEVLQSSWDQVADREVQRLLYLAHATRANRAGTRSSCGSGPSRSMQASVAKTSTTPSSTPQTMSVQRSSAQRVAT